MVDWTVAMRVNLMVVPRVASWVGLTADLSAGLKVELLVEMMDTPLVGCLVAW